jgi:hypothetical protein
MNKLPVGKTVVAAYSFTFNNLGAIIGLIWIPMLIMTVIGFFAQSTYIDAMISYAATKNAAALGPGLMWMLLFVLVALLANAMMLVPVLEMALGKRKDHVLAHFSLGAPEWRIFGAYLALLGIALAFALVSALINGAIAKALATVGGGAAIAAALPFLLLFILAAFLVVSARVAFLIPAVTLLEGKIDLGRGWTLAQGNTLRIVATIILLAVPVIALYFGMEIALFGPAALLRDAGGASMTPTIEEMRLTRERMPLTEALGFFIAPLTIGLNAGAVAFAYRALVAPPAAEETAQQ